MSIKFSSFVALFASMAIAAPAIWDGTADVSWYKPDAQKFTLMTAEELAGVAKLVNEGTTDFSGQTIALGADIFLNDTAGAEAGTWASIPRTAWTPIGTSAKPFKGEFDGIAGKKNRKIYGLYINDTTQNYVGLFGYTSNVKISNLDVLVGRLTAKSYVGALIGYASGGSVTNVHSEIKVTGVSYVGGLVGSSTGSLSSSSVKENVVGLDHVGGLVGATTSSISGTTKSNSYFIGNVTGGNYIGGIVGSGSGISNSFAEGSVKGSSYVGGIAGTATGDIGYAYHIDGNVNGTGYVGGLVGRASSAVYNSYSEGNVSGTSDYVGGLIGYGESIGSSNHTKGDVNGQNYVGGLAGRVSSSVTDSYSEGDVTGQGNYVGGLIGLSYYYYSGSSDISIMTAQNSYAIGNVKGGGYVGGLIGLDSIYRYSSNKTSLIKKISNSHSVGTVVGKDKYVGGVLGKSNYGYLYSSYSSNISLHILSSYHKGFVESDSSYVGGIAGQVNGIVDSSYHVDGNVNGRGYVGGLVGQVSSSVKNSYSEGEVTGTGNYVGGLIGYGVSVYLSNHTKGDVSGSAWVGGLIGLATSSVKNSYSEGVVIGRGGCIGGLVGHGQSIESSYHAKGDVSGQNYVGGLVGQVSSTVTYSHSEGNVTGTADYVGGLVGYGESIKSSNHTKGEVHGLNYIGGLAGQVSSSVTDSYSEGDVTGKGKYVGGLIGLSYYSYSGSSDISIMTAQNSYAIGNVKGGGYVGGLIGLDSIYRYSTNKTSLIKKISNSHSVGNVIGKDKYVGGVLGKSSYGYRSSYGTNISLQILSSFHKGFVESDSSYVGGIAGQVNGIIDSTHHIDGDVNGYGYVGGLIGQTSFAVKNSYTEGNIMGTSDYIGGLIGYGVSLDSSNHTKGDVSGSSYVGGLIGQATSLVKNSYSEGEIAGTGNYVGGLIGYGVSLDSSNHTKGDVSGSSYVGGLIGQATSSVKNSNSDGNVIGSLDYVGGAAGSIGGMVRNLHVDAKVVKGRNLVGGLAGYAGGSVDISYLEGDSVSGNFEIGGLVGCAKSSIDSSYSTANVKGDDNVGGLIGSAYGDVLNSYALGNVDGVGEGAGAGHDNLGGLVGYQYRGSISKSMALGNVSGTTNLGGLVGRFDGETVSQSYANGNVTGSYYGDPADEIGNYYIGGLVGYAKGSLEEVYASGVVKGVEDEPVYTGCVVGYVNGSLSVTKSYYDETKCDLGVDGGEETATVSGSPNKTTTEMQIQETFEDWDFAETWKIQKGAYPFLQIYSNSLTNAVVTTTSLEGIKYDGLAKTPLVNSVTLFGETLEYESEYTITYKNNINAGTASINVCGVKPYGGCKVVEFEIAGIAIKPTIAAIDNITYTGRALTPEIEVYNGETLLAATDYSVEYKDNVNAGTATVSVTMKGNYSGSASRTFIIEKATPVISQNPTASEVILGQTLVASELNGGRANVDGEFVWKKSTIKPELENDGYAVVFVPTDTNYTKSAEIIVPVKVLDLVYVAVHAGDNTIDSTTLVKGGSYTLPNVPDSIGYDFVGLYKGKTLVGKSGDQIDISENTVIEAIYKIQTFVITFMNGSTVLQSDAVDYGTIPDAPIVTLPENTAQYTYSFVGWDKDIVAATEATVYTAVIDSVVNKYEIVFKDYDGTELKDSVYEYGTIAAKIVKPADPKREASARYTYTFKGWNPIISDVIENMVYIATFDSSINTYLIAFVNKYDTLQSVKTKMEYGAIPAYEGTPTRKSTAQYVYTFKEWTPEVEAVSEAATYTAVFDSVVQSYAVTFVNGSEELQSDEIAYGKLPEYAGVKPTKTATAQYTYTFKGWTPAIAKVTGTATYKAVFDSVINRYLVTFKNGSKVIQRDSIAYGTFPTVPSITLPKNAAQYTYSMNWDKTVVKVTGDAVYTATIDSTVNKYEVSFRNYDGTLIKDSTYAYGSTVAKPSDPTRTATAKYTFTFKGWTPTVASVTANAVYKAVFDSTMRTYAVTFMNGDKKLQTSNLAYGSMPKYTGVTPTKTSTKNYNYEFIGWSPKIETVVGAATYKAVFDSSKTTGMINNHLANLEMSVNVISRNIQVSAASVGSTYAVFDMQGRVLKKGRVETPNFNILMPQAGMYFVRVGNYDQRISIK